MFTVKAPDCLGVFVENLTEEDPLLMRFHIHVLNFDIKLPKTFVFFYNNERIVHKNDLSENEDYTFFDYKLLQLPAATTSKKLNIEKNLFQSVKNKHNLSRKVSSFKKFNERFQSISGFKYHLYDNNDIDNLFEEDKKNNELSKRVHDAYKVLIPGAYKADLFRYYIIYTRGGVWLDDKSILKYPLDDNYFSLDKHDGFITKINGSVFETSFMGGKKFNILHYGLLMKCLENIESRHYGFNPMEITGPTMASNLIKENKELVKNFKVVDNNFGRLYSNDGGIIWKHKELTYDEIMRVFDESYYMTHWRNATVYIDDNSKKSLCLFDFYISPPFYLFVIILALIISLGIAIKQGFLKKSNKLNKNR